MYEDFSLRWIINERTFYQWILAESVYGVQLLMAIKFRFGNSKNIRKQTNKKILKRKNIVKMIFFFWIKYENWMNRFFSNYYNQLITFQSMCFQQAFGIKNSKFYANLSCTNFFTSSFLRLYFQIIFFYLSKVGKI